MGISIFGSWWLLSDYMHLSKLFQWYIRDDELLHSYKKKKRESNVETHGKSHEWRSERKQAEREM